MLLIFIAFWGISNAVLALLSISKIKKNLKQLDFIWWWALPTGAFVWEDIFVFGILHAGLAFISLIINNTDFWLISFLVFWIVRSAGETLYFFLEQFLVPQHHPHNISDHFGPLKKVFGNISDQKSFILMQVIMQSISVICIISLIFVLKYNF